jgi:ASCH domain
MKALSVRQPWAYFIVRGFKPVENRQWRTQYRGPLLIHAAKGMTRFEYEDCMELAAAIARSTKTEIPLPTFEELERGCLVGRVDLVDCVTDHSSPWFSGKFGFVLRNAKQLPFLPYKGQLGFFDIPDDLLRAA